jgi:spore germination protein GerM
MAARNETMRNHLKHVLLFILLIFAAEMAIAVAKGQSRPRRAMREVTVYMWSPAAENGDRYNLMPVHRMVYWMTPARSALEALIAGPTGNERGNGIRSPHTENISIKNLQIANGTALVSLNSACPECGRFNGPEDALRFKEAIELTLKQFPSVRRVRICLDGYEDFHEAESRKRCRW